MKNSLLTLVLAFGLTSCTTTRTQCDTIVKERLDEQNCYEVEEEDTAATMLYVVLIGVVLGL